MKPFKSSATSPFKPWERAAQTPAHALNRVPAASPPGRPYLVADELPLLLVVVLPQQPGFVGRQVHRILQGEKESQREGPQRARAREESDTGKPRQRGCGCSNCFMGIPVDRVIQKHSLSTSTLAPKAAVSHTAGPATPLLPRGCAGKQEGTAAPFGELCTCGAWTASLSAEGSPGRPSA